MEPIPGGSGERSPRPSVVVAPLDRRRFLIFVGGAVAYVALRPHLAWARRRGGLTRLQPWTLPEDPPGDPIELARALIGAAVLAPNYWNSQPWRFEVESSSIRLVVDPHRTLPVTDPTQRSLMISLGAALENLLVAARAYGLRPKISYFPNEGATDVVAEVSWTNGDVRRGRTMFSAIPNRRTNRRDYDGRGIFPQNRAQLVAQVPEGCRLHWLEGQEEIEAIARMARESVEARVMDSKAQHEQYAWMRFGDDEARQRGDGVTVDALELGGPARWLAGRYFNPGSWFHKLGAQSAGKQARAGIRSAGALALLTTLRGGAPQWVAGGQAYERLALKATVLGIAHQPINAPIELEPWRGEALRLFGAAGEEPLMLIRLGHAKRPPPTVRRSVALVASFRTT